MSLKKVYEKNGIKFYRVTDIFGKSFMLASMGKRDKIVHSEEEAFIYFKIKV